jgi:hypothetical protein
MMRPSLKARPGKQNILRGIVLLCRGRASGFAEMGTGPEAFLSSLAPLIAFPLVGCVLMVAQGKIEDGLADFLATLIALLAPPVVASRPQSTGASGRCPCWALCWCSSPASWCRPACQCGPR